MMSALEAIDFDDAQCLVEIDEFAQLLAANAELSEREHILPFFQARRHLSALLGSANPYLFTADRIAYEMSLIGEFTADVVVGDWHRKTFCFTEFEDGMPNSIFVKRGRQSREWAGRFDHGFSQIVDWLWKLEDLKNTATFERQFGAGRITYMAMLVIGRDSGLTDEDRLRLAWRREHVVVNSKRVYCCTFDDLERDLRQRLQSYVRVTGST